MAYQLVAQSGDTLAVPHLVVAQLARADGDTMRVALYLLAGGAMDPRTIAHDLGLKSIEAAKRTLQFWVGAGLLVPEHGAAAAPQKTEEQKTAQIDLAGMNDPFIAVLCTEAQNAFGKALGRSELQRLVALYVNDGWQPDVLLLCCAEVARLGRHSVAAVARELTTWRADGIETGEDAEKYLRRRQKRETWYAETAPLFAVEPHAFTRWERTAIARWHEEWGYGNEMVEEALLRAENHRTVRYVDGILRSWRAQGLTTVQAVRGKGQLSGSNILATGAKPQAPKKDMFQRDWNAVFDEDMEG